MTLKSMVRRIEDMERRWQAEIEKQARWPAGAPNSKGGQFAPESGGAGGSGGSGSKPKINAPQYGIGGFAAAQQQYFQGLYGGEPAAPKGPPPGAKPHPQKNDKGEPVTVNYPTKASDPQTWSDPNSAATFVPGGKTPDALNGVSFSSWKAPDTIEGWAKASGQNPKIDADYPFEHSPGKNVGAGVIIREPDGRLWITRPTNGFGGYDHTWPKGTVEGGLNLQASAIKEAYEETGLKVKIVGVLGDFERTTSKARYYVAERVGGTPADMGWESQAMRLVPPGKLGKYLNRTVDKEIAEAFEGEMLLKRLEKAKGARGGKFNPDQPRWPAGSPLGGQWMKVGTDGIILPPKIAGGLEGKNPAYQKKADAAHSFAQANDKVVLAATLVALDTKVKADAAAGKASSHVKWNAQLHQYVAKLVGDMAAGPKATASADAIRGPLDLSKLAMVGAKPGGSNPGALYADGKGGTLLVKGNLKLTQGSVSAKTSDDRAKNEVLAAKLIIAAGGGAPDMKLVDLKGQYGGGLGVASRMMDGVIGFNPANALHVAAAQKDFALHAWLGNYDVLGVGYDNTVISKGTGKAVNIDPGGAILFRAQGLPKDSFGKDASEWESMRTTTSEQKAVFGKMTGSQLQESAKALAAIDDATITKLVGTYGPGDAKAKADLTATLIARRDAILEKAGLKTFTMAAGVSVAEPAPAPAVPRIKDVVKPAAGGGLPTGKPAFLASTPSAVAYYGGLADKATDLHAAGDLAGLKALTTTKKGTPAWPVGSPNGKMMATFHGALVADLEAKQGQAVQAVASGAATMAAGGKVWQAENGVLNPVAGGAKSGPVFDNLVGGMSTFNADKIKAAIYETNKKEFGVKTAGAAVALYEASGPNAWKGQPIATMIKAAESGEMNVLLGINPGGKFGESLKTNLINALATTITSTPPAQELADAIAPKGMPKGAIKRIIDAHYTGGGAGEDFMSGMLPKNSPVKDITDLAMKGDLEGLKAYDSKPFTTAGKLKRSLIAAMEGKPSVAQAAAAVTQAASTAQLNAAVSAMPNFEKAKLPPGNSNAASHNAKVSAIASLAGSKDAKGLLSLNYGTNTYGKKQAQLANDALAALGSTHKVTPGQKSNSHPALVGGVVQAAALAPAAKPASAPPVKAVVTPDKLSKKPDFLNWNGQGKGLSSSTFVNEANAKAVNEIEAAALKGDFAALKGLTYAEVSKETGQPTGKLKSFGEHPSKHVQSYFYDSIAAVEDIVNPPKPLAAFNTKTAKGIEDVAAHFAPAKLGTVVHKQPQDHQFGFFLALGAVRNPEVLKPAAVTDFSPSQVKQGYADYQAYSPKTKQFVSNIQASGAFNDAFREGKTHYNGSNLKELAEAVYKDATEMPAGTTIYRWQNMPPGMLKQIEKTAPGVVFQATGPMCASYSATGTSGFGKHRMTIRYAKGAKAIHSYGSGAFSGEKEVSTLPGARFVFLGKTKMASGGWDIEVLMLPPLAPA